MGSPLAPWQHAGFAVHAHADFEFGLVTLERILNLFLPEECVA